MPTASAPRLVAWGETLWDLYPSARHLGGCAANVAVHAAQVGARAALVTRLGADELGRQARQELAARGVDVTLVQVDETAPTGTVRVTLDRGEPCFSIATSAAWDRIQVDAPLRRELQGADVLVYGTLAQRTPLGSTSLRVALEAAPPTCLPVCDLNVRPPFATRAAVELALAGAKVVKLNATEAGVLADMFGQPREHLAQWLIDDWSLELVALTLGEVGCVLTTAAEVLKAPAAPLSGPLDAVGAGDAFTAVLAVQLARGERDLGRLAEVAGRYAARVASAPGAMPRVSRG